VGAFRLACVLVALAARAAAEEPAIEARALFEKMEAKLSAAKTLHVVATSREPREKGDRHDATLQVDGDKVRIDFDWWAASKGEVKWSCVSDGAKSWSTRAKDAVKDAPKGLAKAAVIGFARTGTWALNDAGTAMGSGEESGDGSRWATGDFEAGDKKQEGKRTLQAIRYSVNSGKPGMMKFTVWIDLKSLLPVSRDVDIGGWTLKETYEIALDVKIEPARFRK
jgi:hypothetical protein